jgi:hypothetical protein
VADQSPHRRPPSRAAESDAVVAAAITAATAAHPMALPASATAIPTAQMFSSRRPLGRRAARRIAFGGRRQLGSVPGEVGGSWPNLWGVPARGPHWCRFGARTRERGGRGKGGAGHDPRRSCPRLLEGHVGADEDLLCRGLSVGVLRPLQEPHGQVVCHGDLRQPP